MNPVARSFPFRSFRLHLMGVSFLVSNTVFAYLFTLTAVLSPDSALGAPKAYWVDCNVSGSGNGLSQAAAFKTIDEARRAIRNDPFSSDDIIVKILPGEYVITNFLAFDPSDSGRNGNFIIYRSVDTNGMDSIGTAQLVGSANTGGSGSGWESVSGSFGGKNVWRRNIGSGRTLKVIYENDQIGRPARSPDYVFNARYPMAQAPYLSSVTGGYDAGRTNNWIEYDLLDSATVDAISLVPTNIPSAARINWWAPGGYCDWNLAEDKVISMDQASERLYFSSGSGTPGQYIASNGSSADRYFLSGMLGMLDSPGEFYYSRLSADGGWLYYYPYCQNPNASGVDIRIPTNSATLISVAGTDVNTHAHHIKFEGLGIAYTGYDYASAALDTVNTDHIEVRNCHISHAGGAAIRMYNNNVSNLVYGCWIEHCGVAGVYIVNDLLREGSPTGPNSGHIISNCKIHDIGEIQVNAVRTAGLLLWHASDCELSYCDIYNSARYATSLRGHYREFYVNYPDNGINIRDNGKYFAKNNRFKYIRMTDCMQDSGDGAILHACQCNGTNGTPGGGTSGSINYWENIVISGGYADPSMHDEQGVFGIYLDWPNSTLYQNFSNIWIRYIDTNTLGQLREYRSNGNRDQTTYNVSWTNTFDANRMLYSKIGLKADFPAVYDSQETVICDDNTLAFLESSGWIKSNIGGFKGDVRYRSASTGWAEWIPDFPFTRSYEVSIWNNVVSGASTGVPYTIYYQGGSAGVVLNQGVGTSGWVSVGTYPFAAGRDVTNGVVQISASTPDSKAVRADAVRFSETGLVSNGALGGETGWWGFNNTGTDASGLGHNASVFNASYSVNAAEGSHAVYFNGTNSYVSAGDHPDLDVGSGDFSVALWFWRDPSSVSNLRILSKGAATDTSAGYCIYGSDTTVTFALSSGDSSKPRRYLTGTHLGTNTWNHLAVTVSRSGYMTLYINGAKAAEQNVSDWNGIDLSNAYDLNLGRNVSSGILYWSGRIDDAAVFQRVLSDFEVGTLSD